MTRRPACATCGLRFNHQPGCTAVNHLHAATLAPGHTSHFRLPCNTTWQTTAVNTRAAFGSWPHEAATGAITEPVTAHHVRLATRFGAAFAATCVYWLPAPSVRFHLRLPGGRRIWIDSVATYRCDWTPRPAPTAADVNIRPALRLMEELATRVRQANCECRYWQRWTAPPGTAHPRQCR